MNHWTTCEDTVRSFERQPFIRTIARAASLGTLWVVLLGMQFPARAFATVISGPILNPGNSHTYYLLDKATWFESQAEAVSLGGNLAAINDAAENAWVYSTFSSIDGTDRGLWIGLNDAASEGAFVWVSGEPVTYTNWAVGEPNNANGEEHYVHIESPAFDGPAWNDRAGSSFNTGSGRWGVVEVVPEPSAFFLFASGSVATGLVSLGRRYRVTWRAAVKV